MGNKTTRVSQKAGLPPGSLVHVGKKGKGPVKVTVFDYDPEEVREFEPADLEECTPLKETSTVTWINLDGIHDPAVVERIGKLFGLHPLILEDILNTEHRPKLEEFDDYIFFTLKILGYDKKKKSITYEQVSFVLGKTFVLSFRERPGDIFDPIRERMRAGKGRMRQGGPDYLVYRLIDMIVDNYLIVIDHVSEVVEELEEDVLVRAEERTLRRIQNLKKDLIFLRKSIIPVREAVGNLEKGLSPLIKKRTTKYLRDVYDHTIHVMESLDTQRDILSGLMDVYLSTLSNRLNVVMKFLALVATIFIPLTFIAGIYGMNFKYMPELDWHWGYPTVWGVMAIVAIVFLIIFRRKGWF